MPVIDSQQYWTGTLALALPSDSGASTGMPRLLAALQFSPRPSTTFVVDVIRRICPGDEPQFAVLLSASEAPELIAETEARCLFGFTNRTDWGDDWCRLGFTLVGARIDWDTKGRLRVFDPLFATQDSTAETPLLTIEGVAFERPKGAKGVSLSNIPTVYRQYRFSPDLGSTNAELATRASPLTVTRGSVNTIGARSIMTSLGSRLNLAPLSGEKRRFAHAFCGEIKPPIDISLRAEKKAAAPSEPVLRRRRPDALTATGYRFEDVELFGFRIDLRQYGSRADAALRDMIEPLNFHLRPGFDAQVGGANQGQDFVFRPAARTVMIELLRYGKMFWGEQAANPASDRYTSQHELLMRILVGRVDDDSSQARDPALYVPAIFVDNAWSKMIGRELQGFDKRLVSFETNRGALSIDGFTGVGKEAMRMPLSSVFAVKPVLELGKDAQEPALIEVTYPPTLDSTDRWQASATGTDSVVASALIGSPWRQGDFPDEEFRRSFARDVFADGFNRFRSIQVAPVDHRELPGAWINGKFTLSKALAAYPPGIVRLKLGSPAGAPRAWVTLHKLLGNADIALPSGSWYRAKCSIRMEVEDGL